MRIERTSPAGRLFELLNEALQMDGNKAAMNVWADVLKIDPADRAAVFAGVGDTLRLIVESKVIVAANPELKQELFLSTLSNVESVLTSHHLPGQWSSVRQGLAGPPMVAMEFCAEALDRLSDELKVDQSVLDALRAELDAMLQKVLSADLDGEVKAEFALRLEELRDSVVRYRIEGAARVRRGADALVGTLVSTSRRPNATQRVTLVKDILTVSNAAYELVEKATKHAPQLQAAVQPLLTLLGAG